MISYLFRILGLCLALASVRERGSAPKGGRRSTMLIRSGSSACQVQWQWQFVHRVQWDPMHAITLLTDYYIWHQLYVQTQRWSAVAVAICAVAA